MDRLRLRTIEEVEAALAPYIAVAAETTGKDITTERTFELSRLVGSPHERLKVIHVAGTSGKTSTCYFIARLLSSTGAKVGLTASPHIYSIAERVQIGGESLSEQEFCDLLSEFLGYVELAPEKPSYFELMMVFALWVFDRKNVDYAVVETGLGGLHDSSNICRQPDKICVLTDIGLDHIHILGSTIGQIAKQKAGIIASKNVVMMHEQSPEIVNIVKQAAHEQNASLKIIQPEKFATYQDRNMHLAYEVVREICRRDGRDFPDQREVKKVQELGVPGRMQVSTRGGSTIILDGAHNEQKMAALVETLQRTYPGEQFVVVMAMRENKAFHEAIQLLVPITSRAIVTSFAALQDAPIHAVTPDELQKEFVSRGVSCQVSPNIEQAVGEAVASGGTRILVTGSLYAVAEYLNVANKA